MLVSAAGPVDDGPELLVAGPAARLLPPKNELRPDCTAEDCRLGAEGVIERLPPKLPLRPALLLDIPLDLPPPKLPPFAIAKSDTIIKMKNICRMGSILLFLYSIGMLRSKFFSFDGFVF